MIQVNPTEATEADLPLMLNSYSASQSQHYRGPKPALRLWLRQRLLDALSSPLTHALVANSDGVALGCLVAARESDTLVVHHLYTKAAYRRSQVASQLLAFACANLGGTDLAYSCRAFPAARRWAERLGASQEDYVAHYSGPSGLHQGRTSGR